jgi:hypothetical protein
MLHVNLRVDVYGTLKVTQPILKLEYLGFNSRQG